MENSDGVHWCKRLLLAFEGQGSFTDYTHMMQVCIGFQLNTPAKVNSFKQGLRNIIKHYEEEE